VQVPLINIHLAVFQLIDLSEQESRTNKTESSTTKPSSITADDCRTESGTDTSPFLVSLDKQISESIVKFKALQSTQQRRSYSLVKAVGQVALSAAIGVVKTIGFGASAIIEARRETLDHNTQSHFSSPVVSATSSPRGSVRLKSPYQNPEILLSNPYDNDDDNDDADDDGESEADLVSRLNLSSSNANATKARK
jgi:hypothetical protein